MAHTAQVVDAAGVPEAPSASQDGSAREIRLLPGQGVPGSMLGAMPQRLLAGQPVTESADQKLKKRVVAVSIAIAVFVVMAAVAQSVCNIATSALIAEKLQGIDEINRDPHIAGFVGSLPAMAFTGGVNYIMFATASGLLFTLCACLATQTNNTCCAGCFCCCTGCQLCTSCFGLSATLLTLIWLASIDEGLEMWLKRCDPVEVCMGNGTVTNQTEIVDCLATGLWRQYKPRFSARMPADICPPIFLQCDHDRAKEDQLSVHEPAERWWNDEVDWSNTTSGPVEDLLREGCGAVHLDDNILWTGYDTSSMTEQARHWKAVAREGQRSQEWREAGWRECCEQCKEQAHCDLPCVAWVFMHDGYCYQKYDTLELPVEFSGRPATVGSDAGILADYLRKEVRDSNNGLLLTTSRSTATSGTTATSTAVGRAAEPTKSTMTVSTSATTARQTLSLGRRLRVPQDLNRRPRPGGYDPHHDPMPLPDDPLTMCNVTPAVNIFHSVRLHEPEVLAGLLTFTAIRAVTMVPLLVFFACGCWFGQALYSKLQSGTIRLELPGTEMQTVQQPLMLSSAQAIQPQPAPEERPRAPLVLRPPANIPPAVPPEVATNEAE